MKLGVLAVLLAIFLVSGCAGTSVKYTENNAPEKNVIDVIPSLVTAEKVSSGYEISITNNKGTPHEFTILAICEECDFEQPSPVIIENSDKIFIATGSSEVQGFRVYDENENLYASVKI